MPKFTAVATTVLLLARCACAQTGPVRAAADAAYTQGRFAEAAAMYERLFEASSSPELLLRLAAAYQLAGNLTKAHFLYESYLTVFPQGREEPEVRRRLAALREQLEQLPPPAKADAAETVVATPRPRLTPLRRTAIALGGASLVVAGVGAGLAGSIPAQYASAERTCALRPCDARDWRGMERQLRAGEVVLAIAGAAVVTDLVIWVLDARSRRRGR